MTRERHATWKGKRVQLTVAQCTGLLMLGAISDSGGLLCSLVYGATCSIKAMCSAAACGPAEEKELPERSSTIEGIRTRTYGEA